MQYCEENTYNYNIQTSITFQLICKFCYFYKQNLLQKQNFQAKNSYVPLIIFSIEFMKKNLSKKLTNNIIAKELSISTSSFKRYFKNIIIKFGRYIPNQQAHYDDILGVNLASNNQYAIKIS